MAALAPLLSTRALAQTPDFDLRWGGNVFDVFTIDGVEAWTVEDGGRIRHRDPVSGNWSFQDVPDEVKDTIHRIFFLPGTTGAQTGWAVAADGSVLKTFNSGSTWARVAQIPAVLPGKGPYEVLYAVHFIDANHGWIAGLHGIWYTELGGDANEWFPATLKLGDGSIPTAAELEEIEFYELDAVTDPDPEVEVIVGTPILGLAAAEPGRVFRSRNGREWQIVWDICDHINEVAGTCAAEICSGNPDGDIWEPWDIEISRNPNQKLALMCGGIVFQCGLIWRSTDDGTTWVREEHECLPCGGVPCATCPSTSYLDEVTPPPPFGAAGTPPDLTIYRFMRMRTIYSLDIVDEDNSALAVGYNGQVMWRNPSTQIWEDRSRFSANYLLQPDLVHVSALFGVSTNGIAGAGMVAFSTGVGGTIGRSTDGGATWPPDSNTVKGEPYRSHDVDFRTDSIGWMVGQFSRIADTPDAATTWFEAEPLPDLNFPPLHAVTFADDDRGVAVGGNSGSGMNPLGAPRILYTLDVSQPWVSVHGPTSSLLVLSPGGIYGSLKDVTYVPGTSNIWAAGDKGFIVRANSNGASPWRQTLNGATQMENFEINGVAFKDASTGLFVGRDLIGNVALVYQLKINGGAFTWSSIPVNPISAPVVDLGDVAVIGSDAYVVGETLEGGVLRKGIVLKSTYSGNGFSDFQPFTPGQSFPKCEVGGNLRGGEQGTGPTVPVLNRIAIVAADDIWVGGECGRVWHYPSGDPPPAPPWKECQSQTDTNFLGISFPTATEGFFVGYRYTETSQALVRYQ